jgi:excisionase family DNA binding protein
MASKDSPKPAIQNNTPAPPGEPAFSLTTQPCLSYAELSKRTGISVPTLRRRVDEGKLPFFQPGGPRTRIVFPADVVEQLTHVQPTLAEPPPEPSTPSTTPESPTPATPKRRGPQPKWRRDE